MVMEEKRKFFTHSSLVISNAAPIESRSHSMKLESYMIPIRLLLGFNSYNIFLSWL